MLPLRQETLIRSLPVSEVPPHLQDYVYVRISCLNYFLPYFVGLQQIKEKPSGWSQIYKDASYKHGSRDTGSMDPDVQLCHCIESTVIEIINMSVSGI